MKESILKIKNLSYSIKNKKILNNISFEIDKNGYVVILGHTGAGKSTLLKCILGINNSYNGDVFFKGKNINKINTEKRNFGYVSQNFSLFPHLNVSENIIFGMKIQKYSKQEIQKKLDYLLNFFKIEKLSKRSIFNLSGGEKQKIALARALAVKPELLLLDEPFSSIDEGSKKELWFELKKIIKQTNLPVIHITHNLEEAYSLAEKIGVIIKGELKQFGDRQQIFDNPKIKNIAELLNYRNIYDIELISKTNDGYIFKTTNFRLKIESKKVLNNKLKICIKSQDIKIINPKYPIKKELVNNIFDGTIKLSIFYPNSVSMLFKINDSKSDYDFEINIPSYIWSRYNLFEGKQIKIAIWEPKIIYF